MITPSECSDIRAIMSSFFQIVSYIPGTGKSKYSHRDLRSQYSRYNNEDIRRQQILSLLPSIRLPSALKAPIYRIAPDPAQEDLVGDELLTDHAEQQLFAHQDTFSLPERPQFWQTGSFSFLSATTVAPHFMQVRLSNVTEMKTSSAITHPPLL
jgi:hypothetical protein